MKLSRRLESFPVRLADLIVGHPLFVLAILLALTAVAGYSARNLRFDFNPEAVFSSKNPEIEYADQFRREFGYDETVIIIGLEATGKDDVVSRGRAHLASPDGPRPLASAQRDARREPDLDADAARQPSRLTAKMSYEPIIDETPVTRRNGRRAARAAGARRRCRSARW